MYDLKTIKLRIKLVFQKQRNNSISFNSFFISYNSIILSCKYDNKLTVLKFKLKNYKSNRVKIIIKSFIRQLLEHNAPYIIYF